MKKLQIGIDINEANVVTRVGTGQYTFNILKYFALHTEYDFHLYHRDPLVADLPPQRPGWRYIHVTPSRGWVRFALPLYLLTHRRNDVFWSPAHYMPWYTGCPGVVTIHDLAYEFFPKLFLAGDLYKLKTWTRSAVKQADRVIAVSASTKHDLSSIYQVTDSKVSVIHNGYDADIFNVVPKISPKLLDNYDLKSHDYLLFLGTIQPRKNATSLVQAFHLLKAQGYKGKLVIAGGIGWLADDTLALIKKSPEAKDIVLTGYISDSVRKTLYTYCDVYVLPSLYEGFGVPAIEAMSCGAPVAVSDNSSLPEVVGDSGLLFKATDPAGIAEVIMQLKADRSSWVTKSLSRAKHFSWSKCAAATLDVLTSVKIR